MSSSDGEWDEKKVALVQSQILYWHEKQRAANLRRSEMNKELTETLKQHGLRGTLKTRHALRQWRKNGKSNQNFFNGMQSQYTPPSRASSKQVFPSSTRRLPIPQPFQEPLFRRPVRQLSVEPQLPVELEEELEEELQTNLEKEKEQEAFPESVYKPFPRQFQTRKVRSGHSLAGKKAESSVKGKAWSPKPQNPFVDQKKKVKIQNII
jgi:hypothetical protein